MAQEDAYIKPLIGGMVQEKFTIHHPTTTL